MTEPKPTCHNCRFYQTLNSASREGQCRRDQSYVPHYFTDWCGEHKPTQPNVTVNDTP